MKGEYTMLYVGNKKKYLLGAAVIIIVFLLSVLTVHAQKSKDFVVTGKMKYCTSVLIRSGDTLWSIAEEYADQDIYSSKLEYIKEIKTTNHLTSDDIRQGSYLLVTYYK